MPRITDVVKNLLIINILLFLAVQILQNLDLFEWLILYNPFSKPFKPFQIVTHMFMHANISHLFFNMFALYMFGSALERAWGAKRFLFFYLFTGLGAMIFHFLIWYLEIYIEYGSIPENVLHAPVAVLGASGAVFGILAGFGMMFPNAQLMLLIPPIPMKAKYFVLLYAAAELFMGVTNTMSGVAHFAHLGGALFGFLLILYWRNRKPN